MDWINKMYQIDEKMKNQLHNFGIDSIDKMYAIIAVILLRRNSIQRILDMLIKNILMNFLQSLEYF